MQWAGVDGTGSTVGAMYVHTALIESRTLAKVAGCNVYLKLENTQPSGSFKLRGISNVVRKVRNRPLFHAAFTRANTIDEHVRQCKRGFMPPMPRPQKVEYFAL